MNYGSDSGYEQKSSNESENYNTNTLGSETLSSVVLFGFMNDTRVWPKNRVCDDGQAPTHIYTHMQSRERQTDRRPK
jgi:hypothetical protein